MSQYFLSLPHIDQSIGGPSGLLKLHDLCAAAKKMKASKQETDLVEALDGLDALANLAILEEGETLPASSQATTKHPRHRPGCTCIVCIQPPSGKGPKHKQSCDCIVCKSVKRRFKTLMLKREKKLSEKEAEAACQKLQPQLAGQLLDAGDIQESIDDAGHFSPQRGELNNEGYADDPNYPNEKKSSALPCKGEIDLNAKPERDDELSPGSDSGSIMHILQVAAEQYVRHCGNGSFTGNHENGDGTGETNPNNCVIVGGTNQTDVDHNRPLSIGTAASLAPNDQ